MLQPPILPQNTKMNPRETPQNSSGIGWVLFSAEKYNISETGQDRTKITIDD